MSADSPEEPKPNSEATRLYLLEYLRDEFQRYPEVRLRIVPAAILSANYSDGVVVKTDSREYFFETRWMSRRDFGEILGMIRRIKSVLPDRG